MSTLWPPRVASRADSSWNVFQHNCIFPTLLTCQPVHNMAPKRPRIEEAHDKKPEIDVRVWSSLRP